MEDLIQNNIHPVLEEIQRWKLIIGYRYNPKARETSNNRGGVNPVFTAPLLGRLCLRSLRLLHANTQKL